MYLPSSLVMKTQTQRGRDWPKVMSYVISIKPLSLKGQCQVPLYPARIWKPSVRTTSRSGLPALYMGGTFDHYQWCAGSRAVCLPPTSLASFQTQWTFGRCLAGARDGSCGRGTEPRSLATVESELLTLASLQPQRLASDPCSSLRLERQPPPMPQHTWIVPWLITHMCPRLKIKDQGLWADRLAWDRQTLYFLLGT